MKQLTILITMLLCAARLWAQQADSQTDAYLAAKSAVRQVMEEPLYWAGFIMLD
jgi:hypothetical protein